MLKRVQHDDRVECCVVLEYHKRTVALNWFQGLFLFRAEDRFPWEARGKSFRKTNLARDGVVIGCFV